MKIIPTSIITINKCQRFYGSTNKTPTCSSNCLTPTTTSPIFSPNSNLEASLLSTMFFTNLSAKNTKDTKQRALKNLPPILHAAAKDIRGLWALSTWSSRASLLLRLEHFASRHHLTQYPIGVQAAAFISNLKVAPSTKAGYCSALATTARRLGHTVPMLDMLAAAYRAVGSTTLTQAHPATRLQLFALVNAAMKKNNNNLAVGIWLAWKTASRWDDITHLTKESFLVHEQQQRFLVIQWGQTKTNRKLEFRPDSWTVVVEEDPKVGWIWELTQRTIRSLGKGELLTTTTTEALRRFMRSIPTTQSLTGHSIKRGAVATLVDAALEQRLHDPRLISLIAKHKDDLHSFPQATLRYCADKVKLALMLGTQHCTRLL